jgi:hypothetical protein
MIGKITRPLDRVLHSTLQRQEAPWLWTMPKRPFKRSLLTFRSAFAAMTSRLNAVVLKKRVCHGSNIVKNNSPNLGFSGSGAMRRRRMRLGNQNRRPAMPPMSVRRVGRRTRGKRARCQADSQLVRRRVKHGTRGFATGISGARRDENPALSLHSTTARGPNQARGCAS